MVRLESYLILLFNLFCEMLLLFLGNFLEFGNLGLILVRFSPKDVSNVLKLFLLANE